MLWLNRKMRRVKQVQIIFFFRFMWLLCVHRYTYSYIMTGNDKLVIINDFHNDTAKSIRGNLGFEWRRIKYKKFKSSWTMPFLIELEMSDQYKSAAASVLIVGNVIMYMLWSIIPCLAVGIYKFIRITNMRTRHICVCARARDHHSQHIFVITYYY